MNKSSNRKKLSLKETKFSKIYDTLFPDKRQLKKILHGFKIVLRAIFYVTLYMTIYQCRELWITYEINDKIKSIKATTDATSQNILQLQLDKNLDFINLLSSILAVLVIGLGVYFTIVKPIFKYKKKSTEK